MTERLKLYETPFEVFDVPATNGKRNYFRVQHIKTGHQASFVIGGGCFVAYGFLANNTTLHANIGGHTYERKGNVVLETLCFDSKRLTAPTWEKLADRAEAWVDANPPGKSLFEDLAMQAKAWPILFSFLRVLDGNVDKAELPFKLLKLPK